MVDASDLKSGGSNIVRVRFPPSALFMTGSIIEQKTYDQNIIDQILTEENFIVFTNKYDQAPQLDESVLNIMYGEYASEVFSMLAMLTRYLQGICAGDRFGNDHDGRRSKLKEYHQKYGELFFEGIENRNKFRANRMAVIIPTILRIAKFSKKSDHFSLAQSLIDLVEVTQTKLDSYPSYSKINSLETKYQIVCIFDDAIISVFETIVSYYSALNPDN